MTTYLWIALGSGIGGVARYALTTVFAQRWGDSFPWGTLAVNVLGCFLIGGIATLIAPDGRWLVGGDVRHFITTGILGGFTTFSAFGLQTLQLAGAGEWARAAAYVAGSVVMGLLAVWLGHTLARGL